MVASEALTRYSDYDLTHLFLNADRENTCAEVGPYEDYSRGPYSGKLQAWYGCGDDGATIYALATYLEDRGCVVALSARVSEEADREAVEHLINTVEADCSRVTSTPFADPSASASASPVASVPTPAGSESGTQGAGCSDPSYAAQNPGECGTTGYNPVSDSGDNYSQGVVVGDDTPDCARPEDVLESGLCAF